MLKSFDYIVNDNTHTMVIGSMPGVASLNAGEYYAHKHNLFWQLVFEAFGEEYSSPDFNTKTTLLLAHGIGLWDAAKSCTRDGSLDTNIKNVIPNDFKMLFQKYPNIKRLLFNGQKAFQLFKKYNAPLLNDLDYIILPSTSPANASIPLCQRKQAWIRALTNVFLWVV